WLGVVLALPGPREQPSAPREPQQIVRAGTATADEPEDLVREERQLLDRTLLHSLKTTFHTLTGGATCPRRQAAPRAGGRSGGRGRPTGRSARNCSDRRTRRPSLGRGSRRTGVCSTSAAAPVLS